MASEQLSSGPGLQLMTHATSSSGLVSKPIPQQPCNPPKRDDWDRLLQPMFDEYFNPPIIVVSLVPVVAAPRAIDLVDSPVSTSIDQDAPSTSILSTQEQEHSPIISQGFEESPKTQHFHFFWGGGGDDPLHESLPKDSTSQGHHLSGSIDKPMVEKNKLDEDLHETLVNATLYRGMIGSFMYLTSSRDNDLIYAVCLCARYQAKPTKKHLNAVKADLFDTKGNH
ncbi:hypothetical protein Tco_0875999 [Tanacetum coccineum]|uniref:Uncharacterized protein n=1 Tax=Tanacetum coccineum TaxID=301880 RepID=A0ABQ5BU38_9ASTR